MGETQHNAEAFERLAAPYERQIYYICLRIMGNEFEAQDCAQDAMLRAFRAMNTFRGDAKISTWLYTIAHRACMDALRKRKADVSLESLSQEGWDPPDTAPTPYAHLEQNERKRLLGEALKRLSDEQRAAVVMVDLQGLSYEEAAQVMEVPLGTLKSRIVRARQALADLLSQYTELFAPNLRHNAERRAN